MSGLWKPQLGPADETPYKIDRADIVLEDLTAGLRGDLSLLEAQLARASESGPLPPATEAMYRKRIAQTSYKLWGECERGRGGLALPATWASDCCPFCFPCTWSFPLPLLLPGVKIMFFC